MPERTYTLPELAEVTDRPYEYWDDECKSGRLSYLQPRGRNTLRLVTESQYDAWFEAGLGVAPDLSEPVLDPEPAAAGVEWIDFEA